MENNTVSVMEFVANETLIKQVANFFNVSVANVTNQSVVQQETLFDLYDAYRTREKEQLKAYKAVAYVVGTLIILSNLIVVISSGLILRRGQQPKSTYLLLGNVSLADTIIGAAILFGAAIDNSMASNPLCIFQIGMIVCPAMVSIFSVGMIAVDRYFYILHGLYYQRYFNTTRVRISIVIIWMIGVILGFMPATGWVNNELIYTRCYYHSLFPGALILFNSSLSLIPISLVTVLYSIILVRALKNVKEIKAAQKSVKFNSNLIETPKMRMYRGNTNMNRTFPTKPKKDSMRRCASFNGICDNTNKRTFIRKTEKSKSIGDLCNTNDSLNITGDIVKNDTLGSDNEMTKSPYEDSKLSVFTVESDYSVSSIPSSSSKTNRFTNKSILNKFCKEKTPPKPKEANKWRAITVVMLTTGSLLFTWVPYFVTVTSFVLCENKFTNPRCMQYRNALGGSIATLAFLNSILNPVVYAWWHKGFQKTVRTMFNKYWCANASCPYLSAAPSCVHMSKSQEGIFVASLPAMGWTGQTFTNYRCWYVALFPRALLIILSIVVLSVIIMVCVLYFLILHSAVKTVDRIREIKESYNYNIGFVNKAFEAEAEDSCSNVNEILKTTVTITVSKETITEKAGNSLEMHELSKTNVEQKRIGNKLKQKFQAVISYYGKAKAVDSHPSKLKAVKTVLLVTACFVGTWAPYYVTIIVYVKCDIMTNGYDCIPLELLTLGPLYLLGVSNCLLDPLIYAWRHSGFKQTLRKIYWKYVLRRF